MLPELVCYFAFTVSSFLVSAEGVVPVDFHYHTEGYKEHSFVVRPEVNSGVMEIFDPGANRWVATSDSWSNMPYLSEKMYIRVRYAGSKPVSLFFKIQDLTDSSVYETPKQSIWVYPDLSDYLESVNSNLVSGKIHE